MLPGLGRVGLLTISKSTYLTSGTRHGELSAGSGLFPAGSDDPCASADDDIDDDKDVVSRRCTLSGLPLATAALDGSFTPDASAPESELGGWASSCVIKLMLPRSLPGGPTPPEEVEEEEEEEEEEDEADGVFPRGLESG